MSFALPDLPFAANALEPHMSAKTFELHHGKHHAGYVAKLNEFTANTPYAQLSLEALIEATHGRADAQAVFNNAAQHWNHSFFWQSLSPTVQDVPEPLAIRLEAAFGDVDAFRARFVEAGMSQFGSGWVWLVDGQEGFSIVTTSNAETPLTSGQRSLLVCDIWEHAYYVDYQNRRADYLRVFIEHLVDWENVSRRLSV